MGRPLDTAELRLVAKYPRRRVQKIKQGDFADPSRADLWRGGRKPGGLNAKRALERKIENLRIARASRW